MYLVNIENLILNFFVSLKKILMKKVLVPICILLILASCNTAKNPQKAISNLAFLEGTWQTEDQGVVVIEKWKSAPDAMEGTSLLIIKGDTLFQENIKVLALDGTVTYKSTMGKYVIEDLKTLPLTRCTKKRAVFGKMNEINSVYICYSKKRGKLFVEMRDVVENKIVHDKYGLEKQHNICPSF